VYGGAFFLFPIPQQNLPLNRLLINELFTAATIGRRMPFHRTLPWFRTMTPTATGLHEYKEKKQHQAYVGSLHIMTIPGVARVAMALFIAIETKRSRSTPR